MVSVEREEGREREGLGVRCARVCMAQVLGLRIHYVRDTRSVLPGAEHKIYNDYNFALILLY